jgi:PAS domain S-box-containing protein
MKTVLLAYEREQDLAALETLLQSRGYRVLKTHSGVEAIEMARRESPQVIVSDVLLPKLDGFAMCRRLKEDSFLNHTPVVLMSFRIEGAKYEAFAAEVGAERFLPRGSTLEELVETLAGLSPGTGTMRMPALVPELMERREKDRLKVVDLERQVRELESAQQQLGAVERVAREAAERAARERSDLEASHAARTRELQQQLQELQARLKELESRERELAQAESDARGAVEQSQAELARISVLESRITELQAARARAQAAAVDAERAFVAQPVPTWLSDMETHELRMVSDSAAALFGLAPEALRGRPVVELLQGYVPDADPTHPADATLARAGGPPHVLEIRRQSVSFAGRACWLTTAHDVTDQRSRQAEHDVAQRRALALESSPLPTCLADAEGRIQYANAAFLSLVGHDADALAGMKLQQFTVEDSADGTVRSLSVGNDGLVAYEGRWRRADGSVVDVEVLSTSVEGASGVRVVAVRDAGAQRRTEQRAEREQRRTSALLDLTHRSHSLTEPEVLAEALDLAGQLTGSSACYFFQAVAESGQLELAACSGSEASGKDFAVLTRWRGAPTPDTALHECFTTQQPAIREAAESTGALRQAGLPGSLGRQACVPVLDGGRVAGVLLLADKAQPYDDEDLRHGVQVADSLWRVLRRRRSDAEIVSAMDHMERVMLGVIESLAALAESQDQFKSGRSRRVAELAAAIGIALGLPGHTVRGLRVMGQVIDVGMLQIPREILWRPGQLSPSEFELVKTHAERGYDSLRRVEFPWPVADVVRQHHERLDGSGYPRGLKGEEILLEARIVAVADAAEAMLAQRPQRAALSINACIEELQSQAGRRYDARVVKACVKLLRERETRTENGEATVGQRIA